MKICIVSLMNIKHSSLISLYTDFFEKYNINYDIIYADKYNIDEDIHAENIFKYTLNFKGTNSLVIKILKYIKFSLFAQKKIFKNKYDVVIIWRTETAFLLLPSIILKKYKYILNVRDYFFEKNFIIQKLMKFIVNNSIVTSISSPGFLDFLPKNEKYVFVNSINSNVLNIASKNTEIKKKLPINISFIGYIRFIEEDKKLIKAFANDSRFMLSFIGEGSEKLQNYINHNNFKNIELTGGFPVSKTKDYLKSADIINNLYGNGIISLDTAISTRYYHSVVLNIPILVFKGTYMEKLVNCSQGFVVKDYNNLPDDLFTWYMNLDYANLANANSIKYDEIIEENQKFVTMLKQIFKVGEKY